MDFVICNGLGIWLGMLTCKYFSMKVRVCTGEILSLYYDTDVRLVVMMLVPCSVLLHATLSFAAFDRGHFLYVTLIGNLLVPISAETII